MEDNQVMENIENNENDTFVNLYDKSTKEEIINGLGDAYDLFDLCQLIEKSTLPSYDGYNILMTGRNLKYGTLIKKALYESMFTSDLYGLTLEEFNRIPDNERNDNFVLINISLFKEFNNFVRKLIDKELNGHEIKRESEKQKEIPSESMKEVTYDECKAFLFKNKKLI